MSVPFPLTPLQQAMVAATSTHPRAGLYVEQWIVTLREKVDLAALRHAWEATVARQPMLRTVFEGIDGATPRQRVLHHIATVWRQLDWTDCDAAELADRWARLLDDDRRQGFDFPADAAESRPPWRIAVVRTADDVRFVCTYHHGLLDGRSLMLLGRELFARYDAARDAVEPVDASRPVAEFRDFVRLLERRNATLAADYWRTALADRPEPKLPYLRDFRSAPDAADPATAETVCELTIAATAALEEVARRAEATLHSLVQASWGLALAAATGADDHVFGSVRACRKQPVPGGDAMLGMLIHTVPFRVQIDWRNPLRELLQGMRKQQLALRDHETTPPHEIARSIGATHAADLFPTVLMFTDRPAAAMFDGDGGPHPTRSAELRERSDAPLTLAVEAGRRLTLRLEYRTSLFHQSTAERLLGVVRHLLDQFAVNLDRPLAELTLLDAEAERHALASSIGPIGMVDPAGVFVGVAAQAAEAPNRIALVDGGKETTYAEMIARAERAAAALQRRGVAAGDRVCICGRRSADWVAAILAVWKLRAVYVPLDPKYPAERRRQMLADADPSIVLSDDQAGPDEPFAHRTLPIADLFHGSIEPVANVDEPAGDDPAVILYTSGSTGVPKGVVLTHGNLAAQNGAIRRAMDYTAVDRTTTLSSPCFDASLEEVFAPLCSGATLALPDGDVLESLERLLAFATAARLTVLDMPTSLWRELTNYLHDARRTLPPTVRALMTGGERATAATFRRFLAVDGERIRWFNAYGPTEATICATLFEHDPRRGDGAAYLPGAAPPIGRPIDGAVVALVDRCGRLVPDEAPGEIVIGGSGVGLGYWRRDDLTAERFIARPHPSLPEGRYYRTGDVARRRADGVLEYVGRADGQIKLRGFRIEPAEIEAVLARADQVRDAVVKVRTSPAGTEVLTAYVVPHSPERFDVDALRGFAARRLPDYMVPRRYMALDALPLTPNGKLADARLPDPFAVPEPAETSSEREPNDLERQILEVWQTTLPGDAIRLDDDFFERGGDSLKAMTLAAHLETALETKLPPHLLYRARTPAALARELETRDLCGELAPLVLLRDGDRCRPLFLIHSLGGDAWIYREVLEELRQDVAVYGLQIPGLDGHGSPPETIEASAFEFLRLVRGVQPEGPYRLAGYSSGGLLALEMARQLADDGERVELLGLIDSGLPTKIEARLSVGRRERIAGFLRNLPALAREAWSLPREQRFRRIGAFLLRLVRRSGVGAPPTDEALTERDLRECFAEDVSFFTAERMALIRRHFAAVERYEPAPYAGDAYLFRSTRQPVFGTQSRTLGWERLIGGELKITDVFGAHAVLMKRPHATELARALGAALAESAAAAPTEAELVGAGG